MHGFQRYLRRNGHLIPNYARRRRTGQAISTAFVESLVNSLLMIGCLAVVLSFRSSDALGNAYGLAVIGICRPEDVRRNADVRPGDALILTKAVGVGIYSAAIKKNALPPAGYPEMIATTTQLNKVGTALAKDKDVRIGGGVATIQRHGSSGGSYSVISPQPACCPASQARASISSSVQGLSSYSSSFRRS